MLLNKLAGDPQTQADAGVGCTEREEVEHFTGHNIGTKKTEGRILAIEAQGLPGDTGDPLQLAIGFREPPSNRFDIFLVTRQINEVD